MFGADISGAYDPARSFATGVGLTKAVVGIPAKSAIIAVDRNGARRGAGGDKLDVRIAGTDSNSGERVELRPLVTDNNDGTYTVSYTVSLLSFILQIIF